MNDLVKALGYGQYYVSRWDEAYIELIPGQWTIAIFHGHYMYFYDNSVLWIY